MGSESPNSHVAPTRWKEEGEGKEGKSPRLFTRAEGNFVLSFIAFVSLAMNQSTELFYDER